MTTLSTAVEHEMNFYRADQILKADLWKYFEEDSK